MFKLRKLQPPFGTPDNPQYEPTYSEGLIKVVDGLCEVRLPETRDRLMKTGYQEVVGNAEGIGPDVSEPAGGGNGRRKSGR